MQGRDAIGCEARYVGFRTRQANASEVNASPKEPSPREADRNIYHRPHGLQETPTGGGADGIAEEQR
jgi:hypothetical protein